MLAEGAARLSTFNGLHARNQLWLATGERSHLEEARRMLHVLRDSAPEEDRVSMLENHSIHRQILSDWDARDG